MFSKKNKPLEILKIMHIPQDDADRLIGGMTRLQAKKQNINDFVKKALKLSKNENEVNFIWYSIGLKIGIWSELGIIIPNHVYKDMQKHGNKKNKPIDPAVQ